MLNLYNDIFFQYTIQVTVKQTLILEFESILEDKRCYTMKYLLIG